MKRHLAEAARLGWGGARANLIPAFALWVVGLVLVFGYDRVAPFARFLDEAGRLKMAWSPWFAVVSTSLFGSLIPYLIQRVLAPDSPSRPTGAQVLGLMIFWALMGAQVDLLYRTLGEIFGEGKDPATIAKKTLVDQFVWVPVLAIPETVFGYLLIEKKGSLTACRAALRRKTFLERAIPLTLATWVVWVPAVSLIYLFPSALQLILMNIILALWSLVLTFFSKQAEESP
jgi:hypothetical protein